MFNFSRYRTVRAGFVHCRRVTVAIFHRRILRRRDTASDDSHVSIIYWRNAGFSPVITSQRDHNEGGRGGEDREDRALQFKGDCLAIFADISRPPSNFSSDFVRKIIVKKKERKRDDRLKRERKKEKWGKEEKERERERGGRRKKKRIEKRRTSRCSHFYAREHPSVGNAGTMCALARPPRGS